MITSWEKPFLGSYAAWARQCAEQTLPAVQTWSLTSAKGSGMKSMINNGRDLMSMKALFWRDGLLRAPTSGMAGSCVNYSGTLETVSILRGSKLQ